MMKSLLWALAVSTAVLASAQPPDTLAGDWVFYMTGDPTPQRVRLTAETDSVRGRVYGQAFSGAFRQNRFRFDVGDYRWSAALDADTLDGTLAVNGDTSRWYALRYRPPAAPRTFTHVPAAYHNVLSPTATPALRIYPGDTVHTTSLDAAGYSTGGFRAPGNRLAPGGANPLTGPFYVEGTQNGDVLAVTLHRVRLNRDWAYSGDHLVDAAVDADYLRNSEGGGDLAQWTLDTVSGMARLQEPLPSLGAYAVPLTPFLGSIGVAAGDGTAVSSRDSGPYGGNMEYALVREGATVYLPVGEEGAYLYLGDGHAVQGDGELTGDALETSMSVSFSVEVLPYRFRKTPRVETATHIASVGNAGSVDAALRIATSDMARWLGEDYGLSKREVALVLGTVGRYRVADVVGEWVGVAIEVEKDMAEGGEL